MASSTTQQVEASSRRDASGGEGGDESSGNRAERICESLESVYLVDPEQQQQQQGIDSAPARQDRPASETTTTVATAHGDGERKSGKDRGKLTVSDALTTTVDAGGVNADSFLNLEHISDLYRS